MSFLLDTNVLSEARRPKPDPGVLAWFGSVDPSDLYLSVLVLGEIRRGVESIRRRDPAQAAVYERWLSLLTSLYRDRILQVDIEIAEEWGRLNAPRQLPAVDGLLAATAKVRNLTLVTTNVRDVDVAGVQVLNPFDRSAG